MEWTIQQVARSAGVTSRTLRHYDGIGLLSPSRVGDNGYRYYSPDAVARLQRILLLRDLGLGLPDIAGVLAEEKDEEAALSRHIALLEAERARLDHRIQAVRHTLEARRSGVAPALEVMLDGFDDTHRAAPLAHWTERARKAATGR